MTIDHLIILPLLAAGFVFWRLCRREWQRREREAHYAKLAQIWDSADAQPWSATSPEFARQLSRAMAQFRGSLGTLTRAMVAFNDAWHRGIELDRLRRRANHFATPRWKRPFYRAQVRWFMWRHYRHVKTQ